MTVQRFGPKITFEAFSVEEVTDLLILCEDCIDFLGYIPLSTVLDYFHDLKIMPPEEFIEITNHSSSKLWGWEPADPVVFGPIRNKPFVIFPQPKLIHAK